MTVFLSKTYGCVEKASICVIVSAETGVSLLQILFHRLKVMERPIQGHVRLCDQCCDLLFLVTSLFRSSLFSKHFC